MSDVDPYADDVARLSTRLAGHVADKQLNAVCKILILAANYGAGDALAGYILQGNTTHDAAKRVAELLKLDHVPRRGGASGAMSLLEMKSEDPVITEVLQELDRGAVSGKGW